MSSLDFLAEMSELTDRSLDRLLPSEELEPRRLHAAMRYSVFAGGKRIRPALVILGGELCGASRETLGEPAGALEMIHCFSLIHDDLPAIDDDDLRRGRPSLHRRFDEATAILAGDALLNLALEVLAEHPATVSADQRLHNVRCATLAVGTLGMIGGQMADLEGSAVPRERAAEELESIHRRKTGALLEASLRIGAGCAAASPERLDRLGSLGQHLGLIFQIRDDILDIEGDPERLGKTVGKDVDASKLTYPALYGVEGSRGKLQSLAEAARSVLAEFDGGAARSDLEALLSFLLERDH